MTATNNDTPIDKDKEVLMEVRGIIDGCIESGSTDYKTALNDIAVMIKTNEITQAAENFKG